MATIRLTWDDLNSGPDNEDEIRIYRDVAVFNESNLPSILATIPADSVQYDDPTAVSGEYYYGVAMVRGADIAMTVGSIDLGGGGGGTPPPTGGTFDVTISSGTVASDLTDFPVMVDLSDMPPEFWASVDADGGNVRAFADDGTTLIPHDLTYINTTTNRGRMFVKQTITAASDTTFKVTVLSAPDTALPFDDPNGRNAVWQDYESVIVFPSEDDRTGKTNAVDMSNVELHSIWTRDDFIGDLTGAPHQGIATDSAGTFATIDTNFLRTYTPATGGIDGTVAAFNSDPLADVIAETGNSNINHLSDGCIIAGELWVPVNEFPVSGGSDEFLCVFNLSDLSLNRTYDISSSDRHVSSICYDATTNLIYATDFIDGSSLMTFSTLGVQGADIIISPSISQQQGIEIVNGSLYVNTNSGQVHSFQTDGSYNGIVLVDPHNDVGEGVCFDGSRFHMMKGDGDLAIYTIDDHEDYRKIHFASGEVVIPHSQVWSAASSVYWTAVGGDTQQHFIEVQELSNENGTGLFFDEGPDVIGMWNPVDSWLHTTENPDYKDDFRIAFAHNGTTERKVFFNGAVTTDAPVTARPAAVEAQMKWLLGDISGEGYWQTNWIRLEYMSNDWMAADADNNTSPSTFYTISVA